ncbi:helix-turn-helix domain-containing protein [Kribbella sp. NBC_01505]|uniref:helix-turn-helix domain-containing protein n=1 Tax=Kribbella sp. NBC_01505 TaxID=2903580 RepID=UPI0038630823
MVEPVIERTFAIRFRQRREARGWSQAIVASKLASMFCRPEDQALIARVEKGKRRIHLEDAHQLAFLIGADIKDLLTPVECEVCNDFPPAGYSCQTCGAKR